MACRFSSGRAAQFAVMTFHIIGLLSVAGSLLPARAEPSTAVPPAGACADDNGGITLGPDLTSGKWLWGNGDLAAITHTITDGVARPKQYMGVMPPMGGAQLSQSDVAAVAAYVWALGHRAQTH
jgi:mono/diheme cytochrome c family protein